MLSVDIEKKLGDFTLKVKFDAGNETFAILGASGCGKSMTLKCIAGIEKPDKGRIVLDGRVLFDSEKHINMSVRKRKVGYLFQDYALFPNMTVCENIMCALTGSRQEKKKAAEDYMKRFYIYELADLYPWQLSGGQKQRVAMSRMLAAKPDIIMLDEPFSALDNYLKWQLEQEIMKVLETIGKTVLFVSHDRNEVYRLTDKIAVMEKGALVEMSDKKELFDNPKSLAATLLTGCKNITHIERKADGRIFAGDWGIYLKADMPEDICYAGYRAHFFEITDTPEAENVFECEIVRVVEDTFSMIVLFRQKGNMAATDWSVLRYELSKEKWSQIKDKKLYLKMYEKNFIFMNK